MTTPGVGPVPIRRLLVANRGEIATRLIEACRDRGAEAVAVYAEPDRHAPFVGLADTAVALGGTSAAETYLDGAALVAAAVAQGCDAVHPGYGFLSENAAFARGVLDAGLRWVGPHPEAIARMGDKLAAKAVATAAGVPTLPSAELIGEAEDAWRAAAEPVGYPLLVKAAAGGGGRGMRVVAGPDELAAAVIAARREAAASFGDGTVFAERWLARPRHIEVQVVADRHGTVRHLGERECSIQRRHQKLIEEAPSPAVDEGLRRRLGEAAVGLAAAIAYDSVGTVEFLLDDGTGEFWFLEMNTRIQVEHRVTEAVTGCDLVELQLRSAEGRALDLPAGPDDEPVLHGHAVEARLYAEDPRRDWMPSAGVVHRFEPGRVPGGQVDAGVETGTVVASQFDPLLAKLVVHGRDRAEAVGRLRRLVGDTVVQGVVTNGAFLAAALDDPDFRAGRTTTSFVDDRPHLLTAGPDEDGVRAHVLVAALAAGPLTRTSGPWAFAPAGWRNVGMPSAGRVFVVADEHHEVVGLRGDGCDFTATVDGVSLRARLVGTAPAALTAGVVVEIDGVARRYAIDRTPAGATVRSSLGHTDLVEVPRFAETAAGAAEGGPTAPVPGRVVAVEVAVGDHVEPGQTLVVLEAMKVEHQIRASRHAVVVDVLARPGESVDAHQLLIRLEESEP